MRRFLSVRPNPVATPLLAVSLLPLFSVAASAQTKPSTQVPVVKRTQSQALVQQLLREGKIMRARDVKRGMTGYGLSVFQGTTIEKFPIKIIGVLESVNGGGDFVLFRVTGGTVIKRQSSIVAGMSGSPVYINGKLLGAISIGFGFPKEAIGGITPISDMIMAALPDPSRTRIVAPSGATKAASGAAKAAAAGHSNGAQSSTRSGVAPTQHVNLEAQEWRPREALQVAGRNIARVVVSRDRTRLALSGERSSATMTMHPATMLLQVSGVSADSLPRLQRVLAPYGLEPIMGGGRSSGGSFGGVSGGMGAQVFNMSSKKTGVKAAFIPGGALGAQMVSGDMDMTGVGTITYRIGNRVLAFGHPMLGLGNISLPMTSAYIHDIFPSYQSSFKLASPIQTMGAIQQDTNFAIGGTVGAKADTVPMTVMIRNPQRQILRTYHVQIMKDPVLTPTLIQSVAAEMIDTTLGKDSDKMVSISLRMKLRDQPDVVRRNLLYAPGDIVASSLNDLNEALLVTQTNSFARGAIQGVNVEVNVQATRKTATIKNVFADRNKVKAGQTVRISVELAPTTDPDKTITKTFAFTVPADAPTGVLRIAVGASGDYWALATRVGNAPPDPENLRELLTAYSRIGAQNELMVQASTPRAFLLVDRTKVPNPPGSWSRLLRQSSSSSVAAYNETQTQTVTVDYSLSGNQFLAIPVESIKRSDQNSPDASGAAVPNATDSPAGVAPSVSSSSATIASTSGDIDSAAIGALHSLPSKAFGGQSSAPASGFRAFENALQRGLGHSGFAGKFSPIEYSMGDAQPLQMQPLQAPANPNAPQPQNPIAPSAGSLVRPTPSVPGPPSATPTPIPTPTPTPTPPTDNGTNLGRPALRWVQNSAQEFTRGDFSGAQVTSDGAIQLSPRVRQLATTAEPFAWSVAGDKAGNTFIGTGNNARIYKINAHGDKTVIYYGKEVAVTAMTTDDAGNLYAGVSPDGKVLRFAPGSSAPVPIFQKGTFVWALKFDDQGRLLIGTGGEKGELYRLDKPAELKAIPLAINGRLLIHGNIPEIGTLFRAPFATVPQNHIRAIATRGNDIFIGTSDDGVLYRVDGSTGKTTALYEVTPSGGSGDLAQLAAAIPEASGATSGNASIASATGVVAPASVASITSSGSEILAVAALPDGVYFGTSSNGSLYRWTESGVSVVYPTPQSSIYALQVAPDGSLLAGTGEKGIVYQFRIGANPNNTTGARLLEPTQTQALSLAIAPGGDLLIGTGNNAAVYRASLTGIANGTYTSNVFDAKNIVQWGTLRTIGSGVSLQTRSGNTLDPDATWSNWQNANRNDLGELRVASPSARYLQYRATLNVSDAARKPQLSRIEVAYRAKNSAPQVAWTAPAGGEFWRATKKLTWVSQDADNDRLRYILSVSNDDGMTWKAIDSKELTTTSFDLDTTKYSDGNYRLKVEASDVLSNPDDPQTDSQVSAPFTIDNTAPKLVANAPTSTGTTASRLVATATDATSPISGAEWRFVGANTPKATPAATPTASSSTRTTAKAPAGSAGRSNRGDGNGNVASTRGSTASSASITLVPAKPGTTVATSNASDEWHAMAAEDGIFDSRREDVVANIEKSDLDAARTKFGAGMQIEIRARDAAGNGATMKIALPFG